MDKKNKIIVLNGQNRNGLAVIRSLGTKGYLVDVTTTKPNNINNAYLIKWMKSRYVHKLHFLPSIAANEDLFLLELTKILKVEAYDYLITAGTASYNLASKNKDILSPYVNLLVEDFPKVQQVHNKAKCMNFAKSLGIPTPITYVINNYNDLKSAAAKIDHPVIVKYPDSYASIGIWKFPGGGQGLIDKYVRQNPIILQKKSDINIELPIIQECIEGRLIDVTAFSVNGKSIALLSQERLLTAWLDGGGGIVNITNDIPIIKSYAKKILEDLKWTGPIEMDWIYDVHSGTYKLLEINPKFWGTTQLTISAGYDFPLWFVEYSKGKTIIPPGDYQVGFMYRWIVDEMSTIIRVPKNRQRLVMEILNFLKRLAHRPVKTDIFLSDIKPFIHYMIDFLYHFIIKGEFYKTLRILIYGQ